jgi:peptide deformylase
MSGLDADMRPLTVEGTGLLARAMLHENDHLSGILFIDHLSESRRRLISTKLKELETQETKASAE